MELDERPWGNFEVLDEADGYKVKRLVVRPGKRLSLQRHARRAEHWHVVAGRGIATRDEDRLTIAAGDSVDVPLGAVHRLENTGEEPLVVVEVMRGAYLGEDDIERFEDDFGRMP